MKESCGKGNSCIMKNTQDIIMEFAQRIKKLLGTKLTKIILYGSYARGDYKENSDIDIMILTSLNDEENQKIESFIFDLAFDFQMEYGVDISVIVNNDEHFNYWLGALPFYDNVQREGIVLNG
jgi:predicted nucleotidyltransferase